jgi:hypothetical protein
MAPPKPSALLAAMVVLTTSNGFDFHVSPLLSLIVDAGSHYLAQSSHPVDTHISNAHGIATQKARLYSLEHVQSSSDCD